MKFDTIIYNGIVLTVNPDFEIIESGAVGISNGEIQFIAPAAQDISKYQAAEMIDANRGIIMPGLVNTHTHLAMSIFRGLADDLPLLTWLNDYIFPAEQ